MYKMTTLTRVAAVGAVMTLAACSSDKKILGPTNLASDLFKSYVAMGNSITAGYQSGGINDATQRQSYAFLLAGRMGTQYHYARCQSRCPAPSSTSTRRRVPRALRRAPFAPPAR